MSRFIFESGGRALVGGVGGKEGRDGRRRGGEDSRVGGRARLERVRTGEQEGSREGGMKEGREGRAEGLNVFETFQLFCSSFFLNERWMSDTPRICKKDWRRLRLSVGDPEKKRGEGEGREMEGRRKEESRLFF